MYQLAALIIALTLGSTQAQAQDHRHGQVQRSADQPWMVWDESSAGWTDVESFWQRFAEAHSGRYWGRSDSYPAYSQVNETDTLLIELEQGPCLMEFWHSRWRRANDVRRWDEAFNDYGGCPFVFD